MCVVTTLNQQLVLAQHTRFCYNYCVIVITSSAFLTFTWSFYSEISLQQRTPSKRRTHVSSQKGRNEEKTLRQIFCYRTSVHSLLITLEWFTGWNYKFDCNFLCVAVELRRYTRIVRVQCPLSDWMTLTTANTQHFFHAISMVQRSRRRNDTASLCLWLHVLPGQKCFFAFVQQRQAKATWNRK